tara:strand:+ start:8523 stop:9692 length:1170 start_codon:yes stop_codon:yes gene_type:complete
MNFESMYGVYHADGGLLGELRYVMGVAFRGQHCSLCDITHSVAWEKGEMKKWRKTSEIPFHLVHLNERSEEVKQVTEGKTPCIVAKTSSGFIMLATDEELTTFRGSVQRLKDHIERQLTENPPNPSMPFTPEKIVEIAIQAGEAIMDVYENADDFEITHKGDESPLTKADIAAHEVIVAGLQSIDSTPIVSEEGRVGDPMSSNTCWLVDPLDGTKEFIKRNGMFTVNIALMQRYDSRWKPLFGVVHAPASDTTWFGGALATSQRNGPEGTGPMMVRPTEGKVKLVASGSHRGEKDESFGEAVGEHELVRMGSSLKACIVAEGGADLYPRFGPTSCWDIAAAHAVVSGAGGIVVGPDGKTLDYDLVEEVLNPYFLVAADNRWTEIWIQHQ